MRISNSWFLVKIEFYNLIFLLHGFCFDKGSSTSCVFLSCEPEKDSLCECSSSPVVSLSLYGSLLCSANVRVPCAVDL